MRKFCKS